MLTTPQALSLGGKLRRTAVLAPAFFFPLAWIYTYSPAASQQTALYAYLHAAAIALLCAYCITMYIDHWRTTKPNDAGS